MEGYQRRALALLVFSLPFNGIRPILNIGELSMEGMFYASLLYFVLVAPLVLRHFDFRDLGVLLSTQKVYILLIAASFLVGVGFISANSYGDRHGLERYIFSAGTYGYYLAFFGLLAVQARKVGIPRFINWLTGPFVALGVFLAVLCTIEVVSWFAPDLSDALVALRSTFAVDSKLNPFRLSGISLEPSFNAFAMLLCVPWTVRKAMETGDRKYGLLAAWLLLLCVISGARTAYVGLAFMAVAYLLARGTLKRLLPAGLDGALLVVAAFVAGIAVPMIAFAHIGAASSVSNVSRSYLMNAATQAGFESPFGQGYGQVTFFVVQRMSAVIQYSWELIDFYRGSRYGVLPPLFSWYARTFGEFGLFGYAILGFGFALVAKRVFAIGHAATDGFTHQLFIVSSLLLAQFIAIGFSIESVRVPQYWFAWLSVSLLLAYAQSRERSTRWTVRPVGASAAMLSMPRS
jgi:hypothetical protein